MIGMCMPELILMRVLTTIITLLRNDLEQKEDEKEQQWSPSPQSLCPPLCICMGMKIILQACLRMK